MRARRIKEDGSGRADPLMYNVLMPLRVFFSGLGVRWDWCWLYD
jgi:hypothetical protein